MIDEEPWYAELREEWRPPRVRLLLIGESAPDPRSGDRRFFYAPRVAHPDNLFRGIAAALVPDLPISTGGDKAPILSRLREAGVFLIDLAPMPVNVGLTSTQRATRLRSFADARATEAASYNPEGIAICHAGAFTALAPHLLERSLPLLHADPLPFPMPYARSRFAAGLVDALRRSATLSGLAPSA